MPDDMVSDADVLRGMRELGEHEPPASRATCLLRVAALARSALARLVSAPLAASTISLRWPR